MYRFKILSIVSIAICLVVPIVVAPLYADENRILVHLKLSDDINRKKGGWFFLSAGNHYKNIQVFGSGLLR